VWKRKEKLPMIDQFRKEVYQSFEQRGDTGLDVIDSLSSAERIGSPVEVSESPLFRRKFSSIYDFLRKGKLSVERIRRALYRHQPAEGAQIAGYDMYAVDATDHSHPEAETLADRTQRKKGRHAPKVVGHRYSWLVRILSQAPSWGMPQDVERITSQQSDSAVAAEQVKALDKQGPRRKAVVADSLYSNYLFLAAFLVVTTVVALVRLRSNRVLYEEAPEAAPGQKGRPRKHGRKFKLSQPHRAPDRQECTTVFGQAVRLCAWHELHFARLPALVGLVLTVEFLKADGTLRFQRPLYLFWSGPQTVALVDLCQMYLWRFAIEHLFRFLKQHMGLDTCRSPEPECHELWVWCCAIAQAQLVLIREQVAQQRPPWHKRHDDHGQPRKLTARQTQRNALPFLLTLGSPASPPKPAGKGRGRSLGYSPTPRQRHPVIKKGNAASKST
jgi:DDE superfamily endonuclease